MLLSGSQWLERQERRRGGLPLIDLGKRSYTLAVSRTRFLGDVKQDVEMARKSSAPGRARHQVA